MGNNPGPSAIYQRMPYGQMDSLNFGRLGNISKEMPSSMKKSKSNRSILGKRERPNT